jgi:hypothetical protein
LFKVKSGLEVVEKNATAGSLDGKEGLFEESEEVLYTEVPFDNSI